MISEDVLQSSILRIGTILAERSAAHRPNVFQRQWWNDLLLDWGMRDEDFKIQLFRFVDVLPTLRTDAQFVRIFTEYFGDQDLIPTPLKRTWQHTAQTWIGAHVGALVLRRQFLKMARTFMAGESIQDALPVLTQLWKKGKVASVDLLGEATVSEAEADHYQNRCLEALQVLHNHAKEWPPHPLLETDHLGPLPRVNLSVKFSALSSRLDPIDPEDDFDRLAKRLRPILDAGMALPAGITVDMEQEEWSALTLHHFMRVLSEPAYRAYPHAGIALQAYLVDSEHLLATLLDWVHHHPAPITIRLVKGAYWDSETVQHLQRGWPVPVFQTKEETDLNYERLTQTLLEHPQHIRPAFGSHNLRSLAHAEACAQAAHRASNSYEFQMLFGMAEPLQDAVVDYGRRLRVYTPIGELIPGMAYLVRRLLENTSNESFLRKQQNTSVPLDALLAPPQAHHEPSRQKPTDGDSRTPSPAKSFRNEPHADFSKEQARLAMKEAIQTVRRQLGQTVIYNLPAGVELSGEQLVCHNPAYPREIIAQVPTVKPEQIPAFVDRAQGASFQWRDTPYTQRASLLRTVAARMRERRFELAAWEIFETGKPWREADADVAEAIDFLEFYATDSERLGPAKRLGTEPGELNHLMHAPRGLVVVISPWNFPLAIPAGMVSAALVTGNAVLLKPSERAPHMSYLLWQFFHQAGLPDGALHFLPGGPELGQTLVSHPGIHMVAFTGSKEVGLRILAHTADLAPGQTHVKHVIAEMGGKNAIIIDETADLDEAVMGVLYSFTGYQGQKCSACSRAIVHDAIYDDFAHRLTLAAQSLRIGPPEKPAIDMGPLIDERALKKVQAYVAIGKQEGRLLLDGGREGEGWFYGPVIVADIQPSHRLAQEEIFGPVLALMKYQTFEEALSLANQSAYALTGGIYSRSPANIQRARDSFDVGNLYINRPVTGSLVGRQPFGGHRLSGVGKKAGGEGYLDQFLIQRVICENTLRRGFAPLK